MTPHPRPPAHPLALPALVLAVLFPPLGVALGAIAKGEIDATGAAGRGMATAALVVGFVLTGVEVLLAVCVLAVCLRLAP